MKFGGLFKEKMASHVLQYLVSYLSILTGLICSAEEDFVECISIQSPKTSEYVYSPNSPSFSDLLQSKERNLRWLNSSSLRPKFIVAPNNTDGIKGAIACAKAHALQIRVLSGGHDYEGLSFRSTSPFVLVDLVNLRSVTVNTDDETAWVEAGATLGELYYSIARRSNTHAFPAGIYPSVGVGGHFSGGGLGTLHRKHGLAADNVVDARIMNANGDILDRGSMGEDLFWAIRGGGGASFGVILAWRVKLARVPSLVTVFTVKKDLDEEGIEAVDKWQRIASDLPEDLFIRVLLRNIVDDGDRRPEVAVATFNSLFLGAAGELLPLMNRRFPELGLKETDLMEMSWINTTLYFFSKVGQPLEFLLNRTFKAAGGGRMKGKSDFAQRPLPKSVYRGINERLLREDFAFVIMDPCGGKMDEIGEDETPFPHRKGNLFNLQYLNNWGEGDDDDEGKALSWSKEIYDFMEPYVSSSPRGAYFNYRDLDLGFKERGESKATYSEAAVWGEKYFKGNFRRLAEVKKMVDPHDFFGDEQSVPPIS